MTRPTERKLLQFSELAESALTSLATEFGMVVAKSTPTLVRLEGPAVFVNFFHGRSSYEVGIEVGRRGHAEELTRPYDLAEVMAVTDADAARRYRRPQASDLDSLRSVVQRAVEQLVAYGRNALAGDPTFFDVLREVRLERAADSGRRLRHASARARAEEAWHLKDHRGVVAALEQLGDAITAAEAKKYAYSKKQLSGI